MSGLYMPNGKFMSFSESSKNQAFATRARVGVSRNMGLLPNPDSVLRKLGKSIQVYRDLRADAHVGGCIRRRKSAVKALKWSIVDQNASNAIGVGTSDVAAFIERVFKKLDLDRIISEILDATFYGYQPLEIMWDYVDGYVIPIDVIGKPAEWFAFDEDNILRFRSQTGGSRGEEIPEQKFLLPRHEASYDNPYGIADLSRCFWPVTFKQAGFEFWLKFTERYGSPFMIGKHGRNTPNSETDALLDSLEQMVGDALAVIPNDASIEILEPGGKSASADIYDKFVHFCRSEVSIALLGQNQTVEADTTNASAQSGALVTEDIRDSDKSLVEATLNQLIRWICEKNTDAEPPRFEMYEQGAVDKTRAERDSILGAIPSGPWFTNAYWQRTYGFTEEDLGERPAPVAPPMGAMFAESDAANTLSDVVQSISGAALQSEMEKVLQPIFTAVQLGASEDEIMESLKKVCPNLNTNQLTATMHKLFFAADIAGRLSMQRQRR